MTAMTIPDLVAERREAIADLCRRARVRRLDLFGSAVRADFDPARSDLDFVVVFDELAPVELADAFFTLKEGLESIFGRPVDLVVERVIRNPYFRARLDWERWAVHAG